MPVLVKFRGRIFSNMCFQAFYKHLVTLGVVAIEDEAE